MYVRIYKTSEPFILSSPSIELTTTTSKNSQVPKTVCLTWKDKDSIPSHVLEQLHDACHGFSIHIFDDKDAYQYLYQNYGASIASHFHLFELGAHKADLFRYAFLYKEGGLYFDIKTKFSQPVQRMFPLETPYLTCTVLSAFVAVYQGILVTFPQNQIFKEALDLVISTPMEQVNQQYHVFTTQLYDLLKKYSVSSHLITGWNTLQVTTIQQPLLLYKEKCSILGCQQRDQYGLCCQIIDENEKLVCYTRHADFPWS